MHGTEMSRETSKCPNGYGDMGDLVILYLFTNNRPNNRNNRKAVLVPAPPPPPHLLSPFFLAVSPSTSYKFPPICLRLSRFYRCVIAYFLPSPVLVLHRFDLVRFHSILSP